MRGNSDIAASGGSGPRVPELVIRVKKKTDGNAALSAQRADGSVTWQRQEGQLGLFFPLHDLTHLAVETVLECRRGFYGLLAEGWDVSSFGDRRRAIPDEALMIELIVAFFDLERRVGEASTADDFNWKIATNREEHHVPPTTFRMTDDQITAIRALRTELFGKWNALPAGETLELPYDRPAESAVVV
jgi:hypothetical protein